MLKPLSLLNNRENVLLIRSCIEKAEKKMPAVKKAGVLVRKFHKKSNADSLTNYQVSRIRFFGQNILEAIKILRS